MGGMDREEGWPVSLRLAMCLAERERDPSGCRGSGLTLELPVHVVAATISFMLRHCDSSRSFAFTYADNLVAQLNWLRELHVAGLRTHALTTVEGLTSVPCTMQAMWGAKLA